MATLLRWSEEFGICRLDAHAPLPAWAQTARLFSISRTPEELSIVCPAAAIPETVQAERGWRCLQVQGPLPFAQVGVLHSLAAPLAQAGVSIFVLSTYDTDYLFLKNTALSTALQALQNAGHTVRPAAAHPSTFGG